MAYTNPDKRILSITPAALKRCCLFVACAVIAYSVSAQVTISPSTATILDSVTITFNAAAGNAHLAGYTGPVFMHTGLITSASTSPGDWQDVVDSWGTYDPNTLMTHVTGDIYTKTIGIQSFYGIDCSTIADSLAFVFRDSTGSIVGRTAAGGDIFVPLAQPPLVYAPGNYVSYTLAGNRLQIWSTTSVITLESFASGIRVQQRADTTVPVEASYAIVDTMLQPVAITISEDTSWLHFDYDAAHSVFIHKFPLAVMLLNGTDTIFAEQPGWSTTTCSVNGSFKLHSNEAIFGGGSRSGTTNLRGNTYQLNNQAHYGYNNGTLNLNISIPFFVSNKGYGILFDNQYIGSADIGSSDTANLKMHFTGGPSRYFLIPGNSFKEVSANYVATTGRQDLPPIWAMGYIQSKYGYHNTAEATNVVSQMQAQDFSISGLVLDLYWFGGEGSMGNLTWDNTAFSGHNAMMSNFLDSGVKTIAITEPYLTLASTNYATAAANGYLCTDSTGAPYVIPGFWAGSAALLDITKPAARNWFWPFYQHLIDDGVSGFWSDLGEPETDFADIHRYAGGFNATHNIFALQWEQMIYDGYRAHYPGIRMFNLSRSGYAGMQRYSTFPWSGDVQRSWSGMQAQIPIMINMGMSGVGYIHNDIGGFTNGAENDELYARWQQMGAFQPVERAHGEGVPTAPIDYPSSTKTIVRSYAKLRMSMLPYNYSLAWQNATTGAPLVRGLFYEEAGYSTQFSQVNDEFLWGPNVLVAPVTQGGATSRSVIFPSGKWFSWWNGSAYTGGSTTTVSAPLETMPLFIRGDAFLPMTPSVNSTINYDSRTLQVHYYPSDSSVTADFNTYMDDGVTFGNIADNNYRTLHFKGRNGQPGGVAMWIDLVQHGGYAGEPSLRSLSYIIHNIAIPTGDSVYLTSATGISTLATVTDMAAFNASDSVYFYDASAHILYTKYTTSYDSARLEIKYAAPPTSVPAITDNSALTIYPNPFSNHLNVAFNVLNEGLYTLTVYNINGEQLYQQQTKLQPGSNTLPYDGSALSPGVYIISVAGGKSRWQRSATLVR